MVFVSGLTLQQQTPQLHCVRSKHFKTTHDHLSSIAFPPQCPGSQGSDNFCHCPLRATGTLFLWDFRDHNSHGLAESSQSGVQAAQTQTPIACPGAPGLCNRPVCAHSDMYGHVSTRGRMVSALCQRCGVPWLCRQLSPSSCLAMGTPRQDPSSCWGRAAQQSCPW